VTFKITVSPQEQEKLSSVLMDIITSAAFFGKKDIDIEQEAESFTFIFHGYCPNEYLSYLNWKYDMSLEGI